MKNIYWVGPRQSDIEDIDFHFAGSITIYGNNQDGNIAFCKTNKQRINHNIDNEVCNQFFQNTLEEICKKNTNAQFLFYNFAYAYSFNEAVQSHVIGLNSFDLLDCLSDKIRCRYVLDNIINAIPFVTLRGSDCTFANISKYFSDATDYVLQKVHSSGGEGTYHITKLTEFPYDFIIDNDAEYLVSPYLNDSISLNTHIAIVDEKVLFFPPSVQIITEINNQLLYQGADFICYTTLPEKIKQTVKKISIDIGKFLCKKGYKGILGIDYLLKDESLFFMEINPRFQASSQLVNKALYQTYKISLHEIHLQAFGLLPIKEINHFNVPYSNYAFTTNNISCERFKKILSSQEVSKWQTDGYDISADFPTGKNVYLGRCIFERNICAVNKNNQLTVHPNFFVEEVKKYLVPANVHYKEYCKFGLLNHGVTLSDNALLFSKKLGVIRDAVFDAIDIIIFNGLAVNVPINCKYVSLSPFTIDVIGNKFILFCDDTIISEVEISFLPDTLLNKYTKSGVPFDAIINLANDRIRINPAPICVYKQKNIACKFCNLPEENTSYCFEDIQEVIDYCLCNVRFRHFLIGGGTYSLQGGWEIILKITTYIRSKSDKDIYLMSIPPKEPQILDKLEKAGITEVAFNLEIFDRELAAYIMPGKGTLELAQYMSAFEHSTKLWGTNGCVRSLLIYGFDTEDNFISGIEKLCKIGVEPIISIFRPLEHTDLATLNPPATLDIFSIYHRCAKIVKEHSMLLGPDCPECQNNTLSYTDIN